MFARCGTAWEGGYTMVMIPGQGLNGLVTVHCYNSDEDIAVCMSQALTILHNLCSVLLAGLS